MNTTTETTKEPFEGEAQKIYEIVKGKKVWLAKYLLMAVQDKLEKLSTVN